MVTGIEPRSPLAPRQTPGVPGFVGRDRQLRELGEAVGRAGRGSGELVLVSGDAGIGKTRLCEEIADGAAEHGLASAWARCWESGTVPAFWPWEQLIAQLTGGRVPGVGHGPPGGDPDVARMRLFDDVVAAVQRAASEQPRLLVVDDLHWADVASVRLLAYVAARLHDLAVVAVATFRDVEAEPGTPVGDAIADLGRYGRHLRLSGLDATDMPALIRSVTGGEEGQVAAAAVHRHTGGNPLFARELVRLLDSQGSLADLATSGEPPPVPATIRGVLGRRLERLSADCRRLVETGAVIGDEFGLDVLEAVTRTARARLLELVDEALTGRVLRELGAGRYAFTHPLVRSILYDDAGVARRVRLHERVGEALEDLKAGGRDIGVAALAHHFTKAAPAGGGARAVWYATEAAATAMARLAYEEAARLYEQALAALDLDPSGGDRCEVLLGLGAAEVATGDLPAARVTYLQAAAVARAAGRADHLALAALGVGGGGGFEVALADREQVDLLEEARRGLGTDPSALRARVTARLSVALSLSASDERRLALSEEALAMARAAGDRAVLAYALSAHCDAIAGPAHTERRLQDATEIVDLAVAIGDRATELLGRRLRLVALLELGDSPAVDAEIEAYARLAAVIRQPLYTWYVPLWRGMRALARGELAACGRLVEEAAGVGATAHSDNAAVLCDALRWYRLREAGFVEEALEGLDRLLPLEPVLGVQVRVTVTLMLADTGRGDQARARLDADAAAIRATPVDSEWVPMMGQLAQAVWQVGGHPIAVWAYDSLLPHRRLFGVEGIGAAWWGSVERPLGLLAATLGRVREAAGHFDAAVAANRAAGSPLYAARTLRDAGLALGDPERLAAALAAYRELGIDRRVAELETRLGPAPTPSVNLFRREGDVWALGYGGTVVRLKDLKGLRDLARLLAQPGREVAAVDLAAAPGAPRQPALGPVIDARARDAYKVRLVELEAELEEADAAGDVERSVRAQAERDALVAQLAGAFGLGGRPRRSGDSAERARQAVTWRIREALGRIEAAHPELGRHLRRSLRTGTFCVYDPTEPVDWSL